MKKQISFVRLLLFSSKLLLLAALLFFGSARPAAAQLGANIYAAADLTPEGGANDADAAGSGATFESTAPGGTRVTVSLIGAAANARYVATIRDGGCDGAALQTLEPLETDGSGTALAQSAVAGAVEFGRWYVEVSQAGTAAGRLCGMVNPALAAPPLPGGVAPGMPSTGNGSGLHGSLIAALLAAVSLLLLGRRFRRAASDGV